MQEIINRALNNIARELQDVLQQCLNHIAKGMISPDEVLNFTKAFNLGALGGIGPGGIGSQPGFDPYIVLGIDRTATDQEIRKAYIDMMNRLHPDKVGRDTSFLATLVNLAYQQIEKERGWKNETR